jgi:hypothetical protein
MQSGLCGACKTISEAEGEDQEQKEVRNAFYQFYRAYSITIIYHNRNGAPA